MRHTHFAYQSLQGMLHLTCEAFRHTIFYAYHRPTTTSFACFVCWRKCVPRKHMCTSHPRVNRSAWQPVIIARYSFRIPSQKTTTLPLPESVEVAQHHRIQSNVHTRSNGARWVFSVRLEGKSGSRTTRRVLGNGIEVARHLATTPSLVN